MKKKTGKEHVSKEEVIDLGIGSRIIDNKRLINRDGSFNIKRRGLGYMQSYSFYYWLITMPWLKFCGVILVSYLVVNIFFATLYYAGGDENFEGIKTTNEFERYLNEFFFSTQTFTTVGYGRVNPVGVYSNIISSIESLTGLLSLALATGLLYGRFSRPVAKIIYSNNALISPYKDMTGFQFRIANKRTDHQMVDVEVEVMLITESGGNRNFHNLTLEYSRINFFTATWTVNHPIDEESPLYGLTSDDLRDLDAEFLILLKGFDDTFTQVVHSRSSYKHDEIIWGAKFVSVYDTTEDGYALVKLDMINDYELFVS